MKNLTDWLEQLNRLEREQDVRNALGLEAPTSGELPSPDIKTPEEIMFKKLRRFSVDDSEVGKENRRNFNRDE